MALEWDDIGWIKGIIRVRRAVVKKQVKATKTRAGLLPPVLAALKAQKSYTYMKSKLVFHNPHTDSPWGNRW